MAVDEAILAEISVPTLRFYRWLRPSVSFGYFDNYIAVAQAHAGRDLVRRWTGGGVVLHGEDFTYSVIVPKRSSFFEAGAAEAYRVIHEAIARTLQESGVPAEIVEAAPPKLSAACFENPVRHDLLLDGSKIAGAAQRRTRFGLLHQGSILGPRLPEDFGDRLAENLAGKAKGRELRASEMQAAGALAASKYASAEWMMKF